MAGIDFTMLGLISQGMVDGESRFIDCNNEECRAAVFGKCLSCGGIWTWCGCGQNTVNCFCGRNEESGEVRFRVEVLESRVKALETGISKFLNDRHEQGNPKILENLLKDTSPAVVVEQAQEHPEDTAKN